MEVYADLFGKALLAMLPGTPASSVSVKPKSTQRFDPGERGAEINDEMFFRELPAALRTDMALELARPIFSHSDVFECLDEEAERLLAARLTPMVVLAGHNVAQEGDEADALFLLQEGAHPRGPASCAHGNLD